MPGFEGFILLKSEIGLVESQQIGGERLFTCFSVGLWWCTDIFDFSRRWLEERK